jgi:hypothetical protein
MTNGQIIQTLAAQIVKALAGPLRAVIESKRREKSAGFLDRVMTHADLQNFMQRRFNHQNGESDPQFL